MTSDGGGDLPSVELAAECAGLVDADGDDMSIVAVLDLRCRHGHATHAALAGRLGDQLFDPQPESAEAFGNDERDLVAAGLDRLGHGDAHGHRLVEIDIVGRRAEGRDVDAAQRGRDEAEVRQHRVAPADVGVVGEDVLEAALSRQRRERCPGIGDRRVAARVGKAVPTVGQQRVDLEGPTRLRRDDHEGVVEIDLGNGRRIGGVEHRQPRAVDRRPQDLGAERRAAHSQQHDMTGVDTGGPRGHVLGVDAAVDVQPAQPGRRDVAVRPQREVAIQQPLQQLRHFRVAALSVNAWMSSSNDFTKAETPSSSRTRATSPRSMPTAANWSSTADASSTPWSTVRETTP